MESSSKPSSTADGKKHSSLTPLRMARGVVCLVVLIYTAFIMVVFFGFPCAVILRLFSIHYSRTATSFFLGIWLALWPLLFEKINKTKVIISGDALPVSNRALLISNHRTEVDWMYLWDLALRKGCLGYIKYVLKSSLMKLPVFGWSFQILEFIPVERKWEVDERVMNQMLSSFKDPKDPLWLAVFPEGTDYTEQKCLRGQKYAAENGLPILNQVLLPKTKGFFACLEKLRDTMDSVYDVTIAYKHRNPSFLDNACGVDPAEVHMHVERISLTDIPKSETKVSGWLMDRFSFKDQLLSNFYSRGHFPNEGTEGELSTAKCVANALLVIFLTGTCTYFTFTTLWFKIYLSLGSAYMVAATHFNIRPRPLFGSLKKNV